MPTLIFQCRYPSSRRARASASSVSKEPPSIRRTGKGSGAAGDSMRCNLRNKDHTDSPLACAKRSNRANSIHDFAELLAYKKRDWIVPISQGSTHDTSFVAFRRYAVFAKTLPSVSPVIRGAADASPQPSLPSLSIRRNSKVLACVTVSPDIFMGDLSGIERGNNVADLIFIASIQVL